MPGRLLFLCELELPLVLLVFLVQCPHGLFGRHNSLKCLAHPHLPNPPLTPDFLRHAREKTRTGLYPQLKTRTVDLQVGCGATFLSIYEPPGSYPSHQEVNLRTVDLCARHHLMWPNSKLLQARKQGFAILAILVQLVALSPPSKGLQRQLSLPSCSLRVLGRPVCSG